MGNNTMAKLRAVYRPPATRAGLKVQGHLDAHYRNFIALSPFYVISSARADGRADASPRGDPPGSLAHVLDDKTLLLPDRPGNRQVDTLNIGTCLCGFGVLRARLDGNASDQRKGGDLHRPGTAPTFGH